MSVSEDLRYPIGRMPVPSAPVAAEQREECIVSIETLPRRLRAAVAGFTPEQWQTPYRPGGWTVHQLVHHIPDSHLNGYTRFKLALTEDEPTIKPYNQAAWAELADVAATPPEISLVLLEALHRRWVALLRSLPEAAFARTWHHPEHDRTFTLDHLLAQYGWHSEHHLAHITRLVEREGWTSSRSGSQRDGG
ncbi:MAG TPA: putative metal-dependent hydrolase [Gemmatimonadaceae bacterium]|jgi:Mycothiol maleylpyruvate isomerase N-terminal domain.